MHVVLAAPFQLVMSTAVASKEPIYADPPRSLPDDPKLENHRLVVVNAPSAFYGQYVLIVRKFDGAPPPASLLMLAPGTTTLVLERPSANTLTIEAEGGWLDSPFDIVFRARHHGFPQDYHVDLSDVRIQVLSLTPDGRPTQVSFIFHRDLEDESLPWVVYEGGRHVPFEPSAVGGNRVIEAVPFSLLAPPPWIRISPYDPERRVWVVHETAHQILVFSNDGSELLMTLGEKNVAGDDETHFGKPQDVAFLPDGRVLVADGFDNGRVVILDADGRYLSEFGERGEGPGQFNVVHSLAVGPDGLLFVADRDNRRIQVFKESDDGTFAPVDQWTGFGLTLDLIVSGNNLWVSYLSPPKVTKLDFDGNWLYTWQLPTEGPTRFLEMHSFAVDSEGRLYGSDNQNGRTQKFVPQSGADPKLLIGDVYVRR